MLGYIVAAIRTWLHRAPACSPRSGSPDAAGRRTFTPRSWTYGRLYRSRRLRDVYRRSGALIFAAVVVAFSPFKAHASSGYYSTDLEAKAACQAAWDEFRATGGSASYQNCSRFSAGTGPYPSSTLNYYVFQGVLPGSAGYSVLGGPFYVGASPPDPEPCDVSKVPSGKMSQSGKILDGYSICANAFPDSTGAVPYQCTLTVTPLAPPTMNPWGKWSTYAQLTPTGAKCDPSTFGGGQSGYENGQGGPVVPAPPAPTVPSQGETPPPPPKTCGGGSCYDPAKDQYCAVSASGSQVCIPGDQARGNGTTPTGTCTSSGDSSVCGGTPDAPLPPSDVNPDPSGSLTNRDNYTHANPSTGSNVNVVVTTYTNPGATPTTSGQGTGDRGPASSSSTGGPECTAGALCHDAYATAPCGADPVVQGDPLLGAAVTELHRIRCATGDPLKASDFDGMDRSLGDQSASPNDVFAENSDGDGDILSGLDSSGFLGGGRSCPGLAPVMLEGKDLFGDASAALCKTGSMLGGLILAIGYALAAIIIYRGKAT